MNGRYTYTVQAGQSTLDDVVAYGIASERKARCIAREHANTYDKVVDIYRRPKDILPAWVDGVTKRERIATYWPKGNNDAF
jgi:hypothetical protein